jgi:hypothetical protein
MTGIAGVFGRLVKLRKLKKIQKERTQKRVLIFVLALLLLLSACGTEKGIEVREPGRARPHREKTAPSILSSGTIHAKPMN